MHLGKNYILKILSPLSRIQLSKPLHQKIHEKPYKSYIYMFIYKVTKLYIKFIHIDKLRANHIWQYSCSRNPLVLAQRHLNIMLPVAAPLPGNFGKDVLHFSFFARFPQTTTDWEEDETRLKQRLYVKVPHRVARVAHLNWDL